MPRACHFLVGKRYEGRNPLVPDLLEGERLHGPNTCRPSDTTRVANDVFNACATSKISGS